MLLVFSGALVLGGTLSATVIWLTSGLGQRHNPRGGSASWRHAPLSPPCANSTSSSFPENARQIPQRGLRQGPLLGPFQFGFEGDHPFKVLVDLIFIDDEVLYLSWVDFGFACPWFPSFEAALAANPFPLPFNGVDWPSQDCVLAPTP